MPKHGHAGAFQMFLKSLPKFYTDKNSHLTLFSTVLVETIQEAAGTWHEQSSAPKGEFGKVICNWKGDFKKKSVRQSQW